jgi:hypothetical protein
MPYRTIPVTGENARRRCARLRSEPKTMKSYNLCSSWQKTTTSLRIVPKSAPEVLEGKKNNWKALLNAGLGLPAIDTRPIGAGRFIRSQAACHQCQVTGRAVLLCTDIP